MLDFVKNGKGEILNLMFLNPDKKYYLTEIAKILGKKPSAFQRYIESFILEGVFSEERIGNMRFFWLNKDYQFYDEIKTIVSKTVGIEARLKNVMDKTDSIEYAFIFGSYATDKFTSVSDVDLFMIGKEDKNNIIEQITHLELEISRNINYHIYSKKEVLKKITIKNNFINNIFNRKIILLKGDINEFRKLN